MAKKKPSYSNPALAKLLSGGVEVEKRINRPSEAAASAIKPEDVITPVEEIEIKPSAPTIPGSMDKYSYGRYFEKHESFAAEKRDTIFLYTTLKKRLKRLTEAEQGTLNDLMNNIVEDWMNQHEKDIKSSLKKLSSW
ncbi:MAG: hypothetical protein ACI9J3_001925 [Parvicellaceae bacterium]|jgi:hypothetical protein